MMSIDAEDASASRTGLPRFTFSTWYVLWVVAVVACGGSLGSQTDTRTCGLLAAAAFIAAWSFAWFVPPRKGMTLIELLVVSFIMGMVIALTIPTGGDSRLTRCEFSRRSMRDLAFAVRHFFYRDGRMPDNPVDSSGAEMSWRVRFLPDLGCGEYFAQIGAPGGEPLHSAAAADSYGPDCYESYRRGGSSTYFAIRGGCAAWPAEEDEQSTLIRADDGRAVLIEAPSDLYGAWYEPRDIFFEDAVALLTSSPDESEATRWAPETMFSYASPLCNVAFLDGSVRTLRLPLSERDARLILCATTHGFGVSGVLAAAEQSIIKRDKVIAWIAFAMLTIGPVFMPRGGRGRSEAAGGRGRSEAEPPVNR